MAGREGAGATPGATRRWSSPRPSSASGRDSEGTTSTSGRRWPGQDADPLLASNLVGSAFADRGRTIAEMRKNSAARAN